MVPTAENEESMYTAFTVTVDLREGVTTGISASDRCKTIRALGNSNTTAAELRRPGHIFPLIARDHGVLARPGHTEAATDLARLAGKHGAWRSHHNFPGLSILYVRARFKIRACLGYTSTELGYFVYSAVSTVGLSVIIELHSSFSSAFCTSINFAVA
jgi:hypothetical protein